MRKSVLITGASRGIGAATARTFAEAGYDIALHYRTSQAAAERLADELNSRYHVAVHPICADISVSSEVDELVRQAVLRLGGLDVVVCNAGVALPSGLLSDCTDDDWRRVMATNLDGTFYTLRAAVPHLVRQQSGAIVTLSSIWGMTGGSCEGAYSASKGGIIALTQALAKELGPSHIRVNCVAPGVIDTEMNGALTAEDIALLADETPLGRMGGADEVARTILFLAGEGASFITGQVIAPNGGIVI